MVIYGEYLFLENFTAGVILILLTARIVGENPSALRLIMGGTVSGIASFCVFLEAGAWIHLACGICAALFIVLVSFGPKRLLKTTAIFLLLTFMMGGLVMAGLLMAGVPAMAYGGGFYMPAATYAKILLFATVAFTAGLWLTALIRKRHLDFQSETVVEIKIKDQNFTMKAYMDTGNELIEPASGRPVIFAGRRGMRKLKSSGALKENSYEQNLTIACMGIGGDKGMVNGIATDGVFYRGKWYKGIILAFYDGDFDGYEVLLNRNLAEGGLFEDEHG